MTTTHQTIAHPLPQAHAIAYHLASLGGGLPGDENEDRDRLRAAADLLRGLNPNTEGAHAEVMRGVVKCAQPGHIDDRPETWLLCAVAHLLAP